MLKYDNFSIQHNIRGHILCMSGCNYVDTFTAKFSLNRPTATQCQSGTIWHYPLKRVFFFVIILVISPDFIFFMIFQMIPPVLLTFAFMTT